MYIIFRFVLTNHHNCRSTHLTGTLKNCTDLLLCIIALYYAFHLKRAKKLSNFISQYIAKIAQWHLMIWNSETTQNLNIYLYDYQTKTAIFLLTTKHKKTIMACSYWIFYKYFLHFELLAGNTVKNERIHQKYWHHTPYTETDTQIILLIFSVEFETLNIWDGRTKNTSKQPKWWLFVRNCQVKNEFETALANFCRYDYGDNASEAVQKIAADQKDYLKCCSWGNDLDGVRLQNQNHKIQSNTFKISTSFLNLKQQAADHKISTRTLELYANSLKLFSIFIETPMKKHI